MSKAKFTPGPWEIGDSDISLGEAKWPFQIRVGNVRTA